MNSYLLKTKREKRAEAEQIGSGLYFLVLEKERELLLSRFATVRIVGSRRSKKQSRSTRRVLRVDTDLEEFQQLQEVGIFSYSCYSLAKSHINGWGCSEAWISRVFGLKTFEPSRENPHCCGDE